MCRPHMCTAYAWWVGPDTSYSVLVHAVDSTEAHADSTGAPVDMVRTYLGRCVVEDVLDRVCRLCCGERTGCCLCETLDGGGVATRVLLLHERARRERKRSESWRIGGSNCERRDGEQCAAGYRARMPTWTRNAVPIRGRRVPRGCRSCEECEKHDYHGFEAWGCPGSEKNADCVP
jgi:hypothetical protein